MDKIPVHDLSQAVFALTHQSVIIYFTSAEQRRVAFLLKQLKLDANPDIILIDARADNKPSGSKAA